MPSSTDPSRGSSDIGIFLDSLVPSVKTFEAAHDPGSGSSDIGISLDSLVPSVETFEAANSLNTSSKKKGSGLSERRIVIGAGVIVVLIGVIIAGALGGGGGGGGDSVSQLEDDGNQTGSSASNSSASFSSSTSASSTSSGTTTITETTVTTTTTTVTDTTTTVGFWDDCSTTAAGYLSPAGIESQPDGFPYNVPASAWQGPLTLPRSAPDLLLTLLWVDAADCSALPVARSYGGYVWEGVMPEPVYPVCDATTEICSVVGLGAKVAGKLRFQAGAFTLGTTHRLGKPVTKAESVARLMVQGTFGASTSGIEAVLEDFGDGANTEGAISDDTDTTTVAKWFAAQVLKEPTYLRQRYRRNTNPRLFPGGAHYQYGKCDVGARLHLYAFHWFDRGCLIKMVASAAGVFQLFVDGVLRTEVATFMKYTWSVGHEAKEFYICQVHENSNPEYARSNANLHVYPTADPNGSCGTYGGWSNNHKGERNILYL